MLLFYELKKIWKPWLILVTGVVFYGSYVISMRYEIGFYNTYIDHVYFKGLAQRYGTHLEEDEVEELRTELAAISAEQRCLCRSLCAMCTGRDHNLG